jgi:hypothetical protein
MIPQHNPAANFLGVSPTSRKLIEGRWNTISCSKQKVFMELQFFYTLKTCHLPFSYGVLLD